MRFSPASILAPAFAAVILASCATEPAPQPPPTTLPWMCDAQGYIKEKITIQQLKELSDKKIGIIVDARTGRWDDGQRVPGAANLGIEATPAEVDKLLGPKNSYVAVYCGGLKCPAAARLADYLKQLGYTNVVHCPEGIEGWRAAGLPTAPAKK